MAEIHARSWKGLQKAARLAELQYNIIQYNTSNIMNAPAEGYHPSDSWFSFSSPTVDYRIRHDHAGKTAIIQLHVVEMQLLPVLHVQHQAYKKLHSSVRRSEPSSVQSTCSHFQYIVDFNLDILLWNSYVLKILTYQYRDLICNRLARHLITEHMNNYEVKR